jgi:hypothetical protein
VRLTDGSREIMREELALDDHQPADGIFEGVTRAGRPEDKPDRAVAQDANCRFLETEDDRLKIVDRVDAAGDRKQRRAEPSHVPEIPARRAERHEGAEADENAHAGQERPAILGESGDQGQGGQAGQNSPRQPQHALVQRFADGRQGTERHRKTGPVRVVPIHGQGDAIGEHHGERRLRRGLDAIGKNLPANHLRSKSLRCRRE